MPTVAPVFVVRVCGLPVRSLDSLRAHETMQTLREALHHRDLAARLAPRVGADLYALVPRLDEYPDVRRAVLRVRRDVHNLRLTPATESAGERVAAHLGAAGRQRLVRCLGALRQHRGYLTKAAAAADAELATSGQRMVDWLRRPAVAPGLALASPAFVLELAGMTRGPSWDSRMARSAAAYLSRTAVKPSPFSSLTTVGITGDGPARSTVDRTLSSSRAAALELLRAWAEAPDGASALHVVVNPSLRRTGGRLLGIASLYSYLRGVLFREDELTDFGLADRFVRALPGGPLTMIEAAERLGVDLAGVRRLVAIGVLLPVTPWRSSDGAHFGAFARLLDEPRHARDGASLRPVVGRLADLEDRVGATGDARQRAADIERARAALAPALRAAGGRPPEWLSAVPLFHEVVAHPAERTPEVPDLVRDDLVGIADTLRPLVRRAAIYRRLVDHFVHRYGTGGTAPDLLAFCYDVLGRIDPLLLPARFDAVDPVAPTPEELSGHGTIGRAGAMLFFQLVAADAAAVESGDYLLVVNKLQPGLVGLMARWACVPALHDRLAGPLGGWLAQRHSGCQVYQFSAHTDWVEFQRPALRALPCAGWGPDLAGAGASGVVDLAGFTLRHDPATGTLQAYDAAGRPAAFGYLGAIPPQLLRGVDRLLYLLSDPWLRVDPAPLAAGAQPVDLGDGVRYLPRVQRGHVVWRRAGWRMAPAQVPRPRPGGTPIDFLADVENWRRRHRLPAEVFVSQVGAGPGAQPDKPQWLGFDHPHVILSALRQIRPDADTVEFTEALPARDQHWVTDPQGDAVAAEFVGLVSHD
jgi:hypothetical protein